ncbi:MAG TPA: hypothetical protein VK811_07845, partial [Candidatus Acidoferrum sp.]|nr:hypothetical protein [Candidatus Acidoferrum sp.]
MSKIPAVNETLALLEILKRTIRDFAAREEKLESDYHNRSGAAHKLFETQTTQLESDWATNIAAAETDRLEQRKLAQSRADRRKDQIERAYKNARNRASSNAETQDSHWRAQVQGGLAEAEERRNTDLAAAATANENFRQKLAEMDGAFRHLEKEARRAFHISGKFRRLLRRKGSPEELEAAFNGEIFFTRLQRLQTQAENDLKQFKKITLPSLFRFIPVWPLAIVLLAVAAAHWVLPHFGLIFISMPIAGAALGIFVALVVGAFLAAHAAAPAAATVAESLSKALGMLDGAAEKIETHYLQEQQRIQEEFQVNETALNQRWKEGARNIARLSTSLPMKVDERALRIHQKNQARGFRKLERIEEEHGEALQRLQATNDDLVRQILADYNTKKSQMDKEYETGWINLEADWKKTIEPLWNEIQAGSAAVEKMFPEWNEANWQNWAPPQDFQNTAKFGRLELNLPKFAD